MRAVLNKEHGILPKGNVLSHITVAQIPHVSAKQLPGLLYRDLSPRILSHDPHTEYVITRSLHEGFADFLLFLDAGDLIERRTH